MRLWGGSGGGSVRKPTFDSKQETEANREKTERKKKLTVISSQENAEFLVGLPPNNCMDLWFLQGST